MGRLLSGPFHAPEGGTGGEAPSKAQRNASGRKGSSSAICVAGVGHTFVDDTLRGQGVAGQLLRAAADQIRAEGKRARATCSYAEIWFERHPEEADLLCP